MTAFAKEYGSALYQLAAEEGLDTELLQESAAAAALFRDNPDYMELLSTPVLPRQQRLEIADEAFRGRVHPYLLNFIKILLERGAVAQFPLCCEQFEVLYNRAHGIEKATAVTAAALSESLQQKLREKLESVTGKTILLTNRVDPSLLGGVRVELDGVLLDDSLKNRLDVLRENLLHVIA